MPQVLHPYQTKLITERLTDII